MIIEIKGAQKATRGAVGLQPGWGEAGHHQDGDQLAGPHPSISNKDVGEGRVAVRTEGRLLCEGSEHPA